MSRGLILLAGAFLSPAQAQDEPHAVVRTAVHAIQGDSAARVGARWEARLRRNPGDRAALLGLATLARLEYDYDAAERRYRALDAADDAEPDAYAAFARLGLAQAADAGGLLDEAARQYERALSAAQVAGDVRAHAQALMGMAFMVASTESIERGVAYLDSAVRLIPPAAIELVADAHRRRAVMLAVQSTPGAMAEADACVGLAQRANDARLEAHCWRAAALDLTLRGESDSAYVLLSLAAQRHRAARDRSMLAETLIRQSGILRGRGELGAAKQRLLDAIVEADAARNLLAIASAHNGLGSLHLRFRDFAAAGEEFRLAISMFDAQGDPASAMLARAFLPMVYAGEGDLNRARAEADTVLAWYRGTGEVPNQFDMLRTRASLAMRARNWAVADSVLTGAAALAQTHGVPGWQEALDLDFGRLALYRGDLAAAERHLRARLAGLDSSRHAARHETRSRLAEVYARQGKLDLAVNELEEAGAQFDDWRATLADPELRVLAFQAEPSDNYEQHAGIARTLALLVQGGRAEAAFALAEGRRARELADRLARGAALRLGSGSGSASARRATDATLADRIAHIASALPDAETALIEFVSAADGTPITAFVVTRAGVRGVVVPALDSLTGRIGRFVALIVNGSDPQALARELGAALVAPVEALLPADVTRLVLIPDGALHRLPFNALRLADNRFVIERYTLSLAPSASIAAALWNRPTRAGHDVRLLAFGDPSFAADSALPRLPESGREARLVARFAPASDVRLREQASGAFLKEANLEPYTVLHFATHALVDDRSVARTALALAPGGGEDGLVTPGDLAALELRADLVVLSACRSAGGVVVDGEGVQGLTGPLLEAGARAVVATGWRISDRATVRLVEDFYRGLAAGHSAAEALRGAKLAALSAGAPASEWAAFTLTGDPTVRVPLVAPSSSWRASAAMALAVLLLLGGLALIARRARPYDGPARR